MPSRRYLPLLCSCLFLGAGAHAEPPKPPDVAGHWEGKLSVGPGLALRMVLHVSRQSDGLHATFDSPDQGATGLPVDSVTVEGTTFRFVMSKIGGTYSGQLDALGTTATGEWSQRGAKLPLTLQKTAQPSQVRRPQEPKPPFPYRVEEATYDNTAAAAHVHLAGTLTLPPGSGPFPAVLLITGSGAQDRDETIFAHKPFLVLADALTRRGVAVLRVDDRGVGGSSGQVATSTSEDFVADALAGVAWLKARKDIDGRRIGLIGHSEGGLIAPLAATRSRDIAFIVLLAGPGLPGDQIVLRQGELIARALGQTDAAKIEQGKETQRRIFAVLKREPDRGRAAKEIRGILEAKLADVPASEKETAASAVNTQIEQLNSPWFRYFIAYDPRPALAQVKCPVLALTGEKDLQVPPKENLLAIAQALGRGGNKRVTTRELPGLNHLFQTAKTGAPNEYATIEETVSPSALAIVADWILKLP